MNLDDVSYIDCFCRGFTITTIVLFLASVFFRCAT
jgi:hypothetical protein